MWLTRAAPRKMMASLPAPTATAPRKALATKAARKPVMGGIKKPHRFRPGA
jgi:hypothetical protein